MELQIYVERIEIQSKMKKNIFKKLALEPSFGRSFPYKGQHTQQWIFKPGYEHFSGSTDFPNQSLKQIGRGVHDIWFMIGQLNRQADTKTNRDY